MDEEIQPVEEAPGRFCGHFWLAAVHGSIEGGLARERFGRLDDWLRLFKVSLFRVAIVRLRRFIVEKSCPDDVSPDILVLAHEFRACGPA